ncbi:MAG: Lrp/AsnC ligand binding domain-containing protein [Gammaproteobacteria bacterium]|nr:Lrp/AsnC ligand binding domain-containing protein [Gammaproteobacteria bacterium]
MVCKKDYESKIDRIDRTILGALAADGRITITDLSKRIGLSKTPCQARVKRLEEHAYILGYHAALSPQKLGREHIAFVQVKIENTREQALYAFNKAVRACPEIEECHMIAGNFDYLLKVRSGDILEYRKVMGEKISALPHVISTSTFVAMEAVKEVTEGNAIIETLRS